jgi:16S rRNA processing protein RimM
MQQSHYHIGKIVSSFGTDGQVVLQHVLGSTALKGLTVVLIALKKDDLVPFFVTATKLKNESEVYLTLEDITSKEKAKRLINKPVWFVEADYRKFVSKSAAISLLGYTIINDGNTIGEIIEVIEQPHQLLVKIIYDQKEVLIPVPDVFIEKIDNQQKQLFLHLPDGILDI